MTSLKKFKERLRGELVKEELPVAIQTEFVVETIAEVVIPEPATKETEQVSIVDAADSTIEDTIEDVAEDTFEDARENTAEISKLESMTRAEIDTHAEQYGIKLDRRQKKFNMITEFIQKIEEKN